MSDVKISQFPYVGNTGYTPNDLFVFVNYLSPTGTTSNTKIDDFKNFIIIDSYNYFLPLSGGSVTGSTTFTNGLTANTISATTYQNLPKDIFVTGGTYTNGSTTFTNNTGGTFTITGFSTTTPFTGGTVSGATNFTNGLTANTISATTITVNGSIIATGITQSIFSGNSSSDLVRITQTGSGRAFVVEDSANPDFTPFQINNQGKVGVGESLIISSWYSSTTVNAFLEINSTLDSRDYGIYQAGPVVSLPSYGVFANAAQIGVFGSIASDGGGIGVYGQTGNAGGESQSGDYIGGKFESFTSGGNRYSLQLLDGTEGVGKVLVSQTSDGKSNWSSSLTGLTTVDTTLLKISGITVNPKQTIALFFGHDSLSPGDTQTYYIGNAINLTAPISGSDGRRVIIPKTGNIVRVDICQNVGGVVATGSTEYSTFTINNVTQSTQSTITTTYLYNTSNGNIAYDLGTPLSVNVGDKIEIRWTTPAWVINPTTVRQQMNVYLEY